MCAIQTAHSDLENAQTGWITFIYQVQSLKTVWQSLWRAPYSALIYFNAPTNQIVLETHTARIHTKSIFMSPCGWLTYMPWITGLRISYCLGIVKVNICMEGEILSPVAFELVISCEGDCAHTCFQYQKIRSGYKEDWPLCKVFTQLSIQMWPHT